MVKLLDYTRFEEKFYPSSDGQPMAENTLQFEWITKIKFNLEKATANQKIFVAGDLLWYPVKGDNTIKAAPDVMVAIGRPKGHRSSYLQWREGNIAPQVAFEILSPSNDSKEMTAKLGFYQRYGVEEYYIHDPQKNVFSVYERSKERLELQANVRKWKSKKLGIRFFWTEKTLELFHPDGTAFLTFMELEAKNRVLEREKQQARKEKRRAEREKRQIEKEKRQAEKEKNILAEKLRSLGIDPNALLK